MKNLLFIIYILLVGTGSIIGCVHQIKENESTGKFDSKKHYRLRMKIDNVGNIQRGLAILKRKKFYTLEFTALSDIDYFSFSTCATNITRYGSSGIFKGREVKIKHYRPSSIELEKFCDAQIHATDDRQKKYTAGYIVFENPRVTMPATVVCGQKTKEYKNGSSICALPEGLYMRVKFKEAVKMKSKCDFQVGQRKEFTFKVEAGKCQYLFSKGDSPKDMHRLVTYGDNDDVL